MEGETFPVELLGGKKVKESFRRLINSVKILKMNFGNINVEFGTPIDFRSYQHSICQELNLDPKNNEQHRKRVVYELGYKLVYILQQNQIIMPTSICATLLLNN